MRRDVDLYLQDILKCIQSIEDFTKGLSFSDFESNDQVASAVVWKLEVMGEAVKHLPASYRQQHRDVPWAEMAKMRDKMIHFYFGIDFEIIWNVTKKKLPGVKKEIKNLLAQYIKNKPERNDSSPY